MGRHFPPPTQQPPLTTTKKMLIQCQSCNTKYRLNLEKIPDRKTFVKCKRCGTPIFIDPGQEAPAAASRVLPPEAAALAERPAADVLISCESCGANYRVAAETLQRAVRFKCSQCGHQFHLPRPEEAPAAAPPEGAPAFYPRAAAPAAAAARGLAEEDMPLPDEQRMDALFDDLKEPGAAAPEPREDVTALGDLSGPFGDEPEPPEDAEQAYLDATALGDDGEAYQPPAGGMVPPDKKSRYFLEPGAFGKPEPEHPAAGLGADDAELPPLDTTADEPVSTAEREGPEMPDEPFMAAGGPPEPPEEEAPGAAPAAAAGPQPDEHLPMVAPAPQEEPESHGPHQNPRVYGREHTPAKERRVFWLLLAAGVMVLALALFWAVWISQKPGTGGRYTVERERVHQLALKDSLAGHYVINKPSGQRLFVVQGALTNGFGKGEQIGWVRVRGTIYADMAQTKPLQTSYAYLGNLLDDQQLATWDLSAIRAYYGYNNGRGDVNYQIPPGATVPFQIFFPEIDEQKVERTVAEVVSYTRRGAPVFVAPGP